MTALSTPIQYTPSEIARLSDRDGKLYELVRGNLVEKLTVSKISNLVAGEIAHRLKLIYPRSRAHVFPEQPTYCFAGGDMRRPDVCMVWAERLPEVMTDEDLFIAPDFVAEVVSPSNTVDAQFKRVSDYLEAGVPIVWVAHPLLRWLYVFRKGGPYAVLRTGEVFKDEPLLPGLSVSVADLFLPEPAAQKVGPP